MFFYFQDWCFSTLLTILKHLVLAFLFIQTKLGELNPPVISEDLQLADGIHIVNVFMYLSPERYSGFREGVVELVRCFPHPPCNAVLSSCFSFEPVRPHFKYAHISYPSTMLTFLSLIVNSTSSPGCNVSRFPLNSL